MHDATVLNRDLDDVHVVCSCGEWDFRGDWDDMCRAWMEHDKDPSFEYFYHSRSRKMFLPRAAAERIRQMLEAKAASIG